MAGTVPPHLAELGVEDAVQRELPKVEEAYKCYLRQLREARRPKVVRPSAQQAGRREPFTGHPPLVSGYGHIEIRDQEGFGFVVLALDYGGLAFEDDKPDTLAEALASLERDLAEY